MANWREAHWLSKAILRCKCLTRMRYNLSREKVNVKKLLKTRVRPEIALAYMYSHQTQVCKQPKIKFVVRIFLRVTKS